MRKTKFSRTRMFAIQINCRGFGYVILEGTDRLVDWGVKQVTRSGQGRTIEVVADIIRQYRPHLVLLEDIFSEAQRRSPRAVLVTRHIAEFLEEHGLNCRLVPTIVVVDSFRRWGAQTKQERARMIADMLPILAPHLPPPRRPWMSEDSRMSIFSAAALAFTFLDNSPAHISPKNSPDEDEE